MSEQAIQHPREIRSYVLRGGRITDAQRRALQELWPRFGLDFQPAPLDLDALFGRDARRTLEIGFGNGAHLLARAAAEPERAFIGIEVHRPGVGRLMNALASHNVDNVRLYNHDAVEILERAFAASALSEVRIYFPDPWPKKRQRKRRLLDGVFLETMASRLEPGGTLRIATDHPDYGSGLEPLLATVPSLSVLPWDALPPPPPTNYALKYEREGRPIWRFLARKG